MAMEDEERWPPPMEQWGTLPSGEVVCFEQGPSKIPEGRQMTVTIGLVRVCEVSYVADRFAEAVRDRLRTVFQR
jgi:hypothetical protein